MEIDWRSKTKCTSNSNAIGNAFLFLPKSYDLLQHGKYISQKEAYVLSIMPLDELLLLLKIVDELFKLKEWGWHYNYWTYV